MNRSIIYIAAGNVQCSSIRFENVDVPQEITDTSPENVTTSPTEHDQLCKPCSDRQAKELRLIGVASGREAKQPSR